MKNDNHNIDLFSFRRLGLLLTKEYHTRRRSLLLQLCAVTGAMAILNLFVALGSSGLGESDVPEMFSGMIFLFSMSVYTMVGASLTFSALGSKPERVMALMEPATDAERFISRAMFSILLPPLFVVFGQFVGEGVRVVLSNIMYPATFSYQPFVIVHRIATFENIGGWVMTLMVLSLALNQAFYLLGSVVWPRLSFIKTFAALQVTGTLLSVILSVLVASGWSGIGALNPGAIAWVALGILILLTVSVVAVAYWRYREIEVVQRW